MNKHEPEKVSNEWYEGKTLWTAMMSGSKDRKYAVMTRSYPVVGVDSESLYFDNVIMAYGYKQIIPKDMKGLAWSEREALTILFEDFNVEAFKLEEEAKINRSHMEILNAKIQAGDKEGWK